MPATPDTAQGEAELIRLLAELHMRGIRYLSGGEDLRLSTADLLPPAELLRRLAACPEARVRNATISLLLLHPELAEVAPVALAGIESAVAEALTTLVLATLYLRRLWETSLAVTWAMCRRCQSQTSPGCGSSADCHRLRSWTARLGCGNCRPQSRDARVFRSTS